MKIIDSKQLNDNVFELIGDQWMLVSAGNSEKFNTMTANWGGMGFLWNKSVAFVFVRPQRYTFEFTEREEFLTLSFFDMEYRKALSLCGSTSGRTTDKVAQSGLTPYFTPMGNPAFTQARMVLECRKLYADMLSPEAFVDRTIVEKWYAAGDVHKMYVVEIVNVWVARGDE